MDGRTLTVVEGDKPFLGYVSQGFALGIGTIVAYTLALLLLALITKQPPTPPIVHQGESSCSNYGTSWIR